MDLMGLFQKNLEDHVGLSREAVGDPGKYHSPPRVLLNLAVRWYHVEDHQDELLSWARAWSGQRTIHLLDAFGASGNMACLCLTAGFPTVFGSEFIFWRRKDGATQNVSSGFTTFFSHPVIPVFFWQCKSLGRSGIDMVSPGTSST